MSDRLNAEILEQVTRVYEMDGYYDTFYGYLAPNTGFIDKFDLALYPGIILNYRESNTDFLSILSRKLKGVQGSREWEKS